MERWNKLDQQKHPKWLWVEREICKIEQVNTLTGNVVKTHNGGDNAKKAGMPEKLRKADCEDFSYVYDMDKRIYTMTALNDRKTVLRPNFSWRLAK